MTTTAVRGLIGLFLLLVWLAPPQLAGEAEEHLEFLEPLTGKQWTGGFLDTESSDIEIHLRFETILGGRAVSYLREAPSADFSSLTHVYWHPGRGQVCFLTLMNRDIVGEGVVETENGRIVLRGKSHHPGKVIEFKTILEIDERGKLKDTFLRLEEGSWVQGHAQEFSAGD
jgi:hypothetical protein